MWWGKSEGRRGELHMYGVCIEWAVGLSHGGFVGIVCIGCILGAPGKVISALVYPRMNTSS